MKNGVVNNKQWCVYMHINLINGKRYIGITSKSPPNKRWGKDGRKYKSNVYFWRAIQKYGWDNFEHRIVLQNVTLEYANKVERCLIKAYNCMTPNGYNLTGGGDGTLKHTLSEESKQKMIKSIKDGFASGRKPWNYGMPISEEQKDRLRQINIGRQITDETRQKLSDAKKGKSPNNAGKPMSDKAKNKLSMSLKGHVVSDETKRKIGDANRGKCTGVNHPKHRLIYCIELNEIFSCARDVNKKYGFSSSNIGECCRGNRKFAHKHPVTNEKLHWLYIEDALCKNYITHDQLDRYIKNNSTKLLKGDDNNGE